MKRLRDLFSWKCKCPSPPAPLPRGLRPDPPKAPSPPPAEAAGQALDKALEMAGEIARLKAKIEKLSRYLATYQRQAGLLREEWPALHTRFFTQRGEAEKAAGIPLNPRKRKSK